MSEVAATGATRRVRYSVAMSLDGFIADSDGGYDWIVDEPAIDFGAFFAKIDTLLMGRATYEIMLAAPGGLDAYSAMEIYVVSGTLDPEDHPDVTIISSDVVETVRALKERAPDPDGPRRGGDVWLFGGGVLFRSLLESGLVDRVEVGVVPALLGEGIPLLPGLEARVVGLELHSSETFDSGIVLLKYDVRG